MLECFWNSKYFYSKMLRWEELFLCIFAVLVCYIVEFLKVALKIDSP